MLWTAFVFGLLSSLHCVGMCGPIAFALPVHKGTKVNKWKKILMYHTGRLVTYASIGAIFGLFGRAFVLAGLQQSLSIFAGIILIAVAFFQKFTRNVIEKKSATSVLSLLQKGYQNLANSKHPFRFFNLGMLNGILPCGTIYIALIGSIATQALWKGSLYMFVFGLGTLPLMLALMGAKLFATSKFRTAFKWIVPVMLFAVGSLFIIRGLGLGIAFMSPSDLSLQIHLVPVGCP